MSDGQSTFIKTHKQLVVVVALGFLIPIALIVSLSQLVTDMKPPGDAEAHSQLLSRIKPFGEVTIADASNPKGNLTGEQVFQSVCKTCHEPGIAGAPKVGDKAQWAASNKKGYEALFTAVDDELLAVPTVRHADYIGAWLDVLRENNRAIVRAASQASKAADYLLGFAPEIDPSALVETVGGRSRSSMMLDLRWSWEE